MKNTRKIIAFLFLVIFTVTSINLSVINIQAAKKKTVACPVDSKWVTSGKYEFQLTGDKILKCKKGKKTIEVASYVNKAFVYGSNVAYRTDNGIFVYEAGIDTSYNVTMKYAEGVSSTVAFSDVVLAGYGKGGIIYYAVTVNRGQKILYAFDYKAGTVVPVDAYGYISKVYSIDKYIFFKTNTCADSNATGSLCRLDVTTGKNTVIAHNAISVSFAGKKVFWAEPAGDYTYSLGIGSLNIKTCGIADTKSKTVVTLDDIDTYKTVVCYPKFVTCTSKTGVTFKYIYKSKRKEAFEAYRQSDLLIKETVLY
ncbi:MAG: hypothetical protein IKS09_03300 [Lachnospiraceae bacterium]|nr:hypothetical protein [Lachnospiraceae bacterium]